MPEEVCVKLGCGKRKPMGEMVYSRYTDKYYCSGSCRDSDEEDVKRSKDALRGYEIDPGALHGGVLGKLLRLLHLKSS